MKMPKSDYDKGSNRYGRDNGFVIVVATNHGSMNSSGAARTLLDKGNDNALLKLL